MNGQANLPDGKLPAWLRWLLMPFLIVTGVIAWLALLAMVPFAMVSGWSDERRMRRRLCEQERMIDLAAATEQLRSGSEQLLVEQGAKGVASLWLLRAASSDIDCLAILPAYREFVADPRKVLGAMESRDRSVIQRLIPCMRKARRIDCRSEEVESLVAELGGSAKVVLLWDECSPTSLLRKSLNDAA